MIERVLVLSALACAGVNAFGYLPDLVTSCENELDDVSCNGHDHCAWNGASCETDECSYYHDQASCPSSSYGSQCFWAMGMMSYTDVCTSRDPCSNFYASMDQCTMSMDQCEWDGTSCETSECSYLYDQATCTGNGCYWVWGMQGTTEVCKSYEL